MQINQVIAKALRWQTYRGYCDGDEVEDTELIAHALYGWIRELMDRIDEVKGYAERGDEPRALADDLGRILDEYDPERE